jgi:AraC-like DNA-binding protein
MQNPQIYRNGEWLNANPFISLKVCTDSDQLSMENALGFNMTLQLGKGAFHAAVTRIDLEGMIVIKTDSTNETICQAGLDASLIGFTTYLHAGSSVKFNGMEITQPCFLSVASNQPLIRSGKDIQVVTILMDRNLFICEAVACTGWEEGLIEAHVGRQTALLAKTFQLEKLLAQLIKESTQNPSPLIHSERRAGYRRRLINALVRSGLHQRSGAPWNATKMRHTRIASQACDLAMTHLPDQYRISELCIKLGVSERTLLNCLKKHYNTTPQNFLHILRLNHAKNMLLKSDPKTTSIKAIAYASGFREMGRFSVSFRDHFGCTPSGILKGRSRPATPVAAESFVDGKGE